MSILLYANGITETYEPKEHTFTDEEILNLFSEFSYIRTCRLYEIPNTWCIWGELDEEDEEIDETNYNKLGSDAIQEDVFSHVLFIHDTEINPAWMLTDQIIYKGYDKFKEDILAFFDYLAQNILDEKEKVKTEEGTSNNLLLLNTIGPTEDKKVLFEFDPNKQSPEFFDDNLFVHFANKVIEYLAKSYKDDKFFYIYNDKKSIIYIGDSNVEFLINKMISLYERNEKYEFCIELKTILEKWNTFKSKKTKTKKK